MRFCQPHWDKLRTAVEKSDLGIFIAQSGQEVAHRYAMKAKDPTMIGDPLMDAHMKIIENAVRVAGDVIMGPNHNATCPLCYVFVDNKCPCGNCKEINDDTWISYAIRDTRIEWAPRIRRSEVAH